jgi:hypothetical protein
MAEFLLFLGDANQRIARSGKHRHPVSPDAELIADAALFVLLADYDPYVDYAWNGTRLADLARQAETLLDSRVEHARFMVRSRTKRPEVEPWHESMVEAAMAADAVAVFARELLVLIGKAQAEAGTVVYSCD